MTSATTLETVHNVSITLPDWATGNTWRTFHEMWTCGFWDMQVDRQTDKHTDKLIIILHTPTGCKVLSEGSTPLSIFITAVFC